MLALSPDTPWPEDLNPDSSSVFVHNELQASAGCAAIWDVLVEADAWPTWYPRCKDVELEGVGRRLSPGASFRWSTNGQRLRSTVRAFEPGRELAWDAHNPLIRVYHRWSLEERGGACFIVTEEAQRGALPWATRPFTRRLMLRAHQDWLERLDLRAGNPPAG
jgi:Polyketide cyclase / dehydrase and lipid transport